MKNTNRTANRINGAYIGALVACLFSATVMALGIMADDTGIAAIGGGMLIASFAAVSTLDAFRS